MRTIDRNSSAQFRACSAALTCLWGGGIVGGMLLLAAHDALPGDAGQPPTHWPADTQLQLAELGATLVLFVHPHCPCTRATLGELEKLIARRPGTVTSQVVFFKPADAAAGWEQTDQYAAANTMPGVEARCDVDGREARRFQALTSGHALLYACDGALLFSGGITFARGHAGDSEGRSAIELLLAGQICQRRETPVFGCPIVARGEGSE